MKANTPLELLFQNTKDIASLKQQIAPVYACTIDLGTESASVAVADTNLTTDLEKAFIVDTMGNLYKLIAFNDDKTTAYIEYYTNLKGEKGDTGATGADGAPGQDGQDGARGYSLHYTSDNFNTGVWAYSKSNVSNNTPIVVNDVLIFKNGYLAIINNVTESVIAIDIDNIIKLDISKKQYEHNVTFSANPWLCIQITNDSPNQITSYTSIIDFLVDNGFINNVEASLAGGQIQKFYPNINGSNSPQGIYYCNTTSHAVILRSGGYTAIDYTPSITSDVVREL